MPKDITVLWPDFSVTMQYRIGVTLRCLDKNGATTKEHIGATGNISSRVMWSCCAFCRHNPSFLAFDCGMVALCKPLRTMSG
jgi:hypothetical protein